MVGELIAGASAFKAMFDMAKALKDINDATVRNGAVIELQEKILTAQAEQSTLIQRIGDLEKEVANAESWNAEKAKYELKEIYSGSFAYEAKADARGSEPAHRICATCYHKQQTSILQQHGSTHLKCPKCGTQVQFRASRPISVSRGGGGGPNSWMGS